jgi:hypothetical protein
MNDFHLGKLARGDVVARENRFALVYRVLDGVPVLMPIQAHNCQRMRGDVVVADLAVMCAMGVAGRQVLVRGASPYRGSGVMTKVGAAPDALMRELDRAVRLAAESLELEARYRRVEVA